MEDLVCGGGVSRGGGMVVVAGVGLTSLLPS